MNEKYKATILWNDAIRAFREQMPVKAHRRGFKSFNNTFTGSEAVDWLHGYLSAKSSSGNDGSNCSLISVKMVTRDQALALLNKFYDRGLFEHVSVAWSSERVVRKVKDDGSIFKFSHLTPSKFANTPLALTVSNKTIENDENFSPIDRTPRGIVGTNSKALPVIPISYRKLNDEFENALAEETYETESKDVTPPTAPAISKAKSFSCGSRPSVKPPEHIKENGLRRLRLDEIENVWKNVTLSRLQELLHWSDETLNEFVDFSSINGGNILHNAKYYSSHGITRVTSKLDDVPGWVFQAMKCLAGWPWRNNELNWSCHSGFECDVFATILDFFVTEASPLIPPSLENLFMNVQNRYDYLDVEYWVGSYKDDESENVTAATSMESPGVNLFVGASTSPTTKSPTSSSTDKSDSGLSEMRNELADQLRNLEDTLAGLPGLIASPKLRQVLRELQASQGNDDSESSSDQNARLSKRQRDSTPFNCRRTPHRSSSGSSIPSTMLKLPGSRFSIATLGENSNISEMGDALPSATASSNFFTTVGREIACEALQLCFLFIPPKNRRWLQLLLRMISKTVCNYCLRLDKSNTLSNRDISLEAFCDVVISGVDCENGIMINSNNRQQRLKFFAFLLDYSNRIFSPPRALQLVVDKRITELQCIRMSVGSGRRHASKLNVAASNEQVAFCHQITKEEYEREATQSSQSALQALLDSIADNPNLKLNEKRKRLKKFRSAYPNLFYQRFPTKDSFEELMEADKTKASTSAKDYKGALTKFMTMIKL